MPAPRCAGVAFPYGASEAQTMLMRRLVAWEPASVHDGLVYIYNCINQGVVDGHTREDVKWLVDHGFVKLYDTPFGLQDIVVTKRGGWAFRKRILGWDGWLQWTPRIPWSHEWKINFRAFGVRFAVGLARRKSGKSGEGSK